MESKEKLKIIFHALDEKKAMDIVMLDIGQISPVADYFIIASASNTSQLLAFVDEIHDKLSEKGVHSLKPEGGRGSGWILMDYGDVIVHLFLASDREFYDIERIWADAVKVNAVP